MKRISTIALLLCAMFGYSQNSKIDSLIELIQKSKADTTKVILINSLAFENRNIDPANMLKLASEALVLAKKINFPKGEASANNNLGIANNSLGNYDTSIACYKRALLFYENNRFKKKAASVLSNLALVYLNKGDYSNCIDCNLRSLRIKESLEDKEAICWANINLGDLYYKFNDTVSSFKYLKVALALAKELKSNEGMMLAYHNMGNVFYAGKHYDEALENYEKALALGKEMGNDLGCSGTLNNIGMVHLDKGELEKAGNYFKESLLLRQKLNEPLELAEININLGHLNLKLNNTARAIAYFDHAFTYSSKIGARSMIKDACEGLAIAYGSEKNFEKAFEYQRQYSLYKDSLLNDETARSIAELQWFYENEKKEQELLINSLKLQEHQSEIKGQKQLLFIVLLGLGLALTLMFLIYKGYKEKQKRNLELSEKNKDILDSINYAKRIQEAILPSEQSVKALLPESFILYKPKDIVSGDFYFIEPIRMNDGTQLVGFAAADCTGHGVSGAFMSMLGYSILKRSLTEKTVNTAGEALDFLSKQLNISLRQHEKEVSIKDGMDICFCVLFPSNNMMYFAGANNPIYVISNGTLTEIKGDKQPVGYSENQKPFNTREIKLNKGDMVYVFSDGYADQFGGPKGKKFKYKQLQEILIANANKTPQEQKEILNRTIENWRGNLEQVDDMLIIGVRI